MNAGIAREAGARRLFPLIFLLAGLLLSVGLREDYRHKHEDNNALHATFARSHLQLGLPTTKGQDVYYAPETAETILYGHHPSGPGLLLAGVMKVTGGDSPALVRAVAISFHLAALVLFYLLVERLAGARTALLAALLFAILPMGAFYGRMLNHEILVMPFAILLVWQYLDFLRDERDSSLLRFVLATVAGAAFGWVIFFVGAACLLHSAIRWRRGEKRARLFFIAGSLAGAFVFALFVLHITWAAGGEIGELRRIFIKRIGAGGEYGPVEWITKMIGFHRRHFTATGTVASIWLLWSAVSKKTTDGSALRQPTAEVAAAIFLVGGLVYAIVFNWGAWQHHYWQYPMLPGVAIATALALRSLIVWSKASKIRRAIVAFIVLEILLTSTVTLYKRHTRPDDYVIRAVSEMRQRFL